MNLWKDALPHEQSMQMFKKKKPDAASHRQGDWNFRMVIPGAGEAEGETALLEVISSVSTFWERHRSKRVKTENMNLFGQFTQSLEIKS